MTAPNILNISTVSGKTGVQLVTTSPAAIATNSSGSGKVLKVNALYLSNNLGANNFITANVDIFRSSVAYRIINSVIISGGSSLDLISKSIYLEEGDTLRITANASSGLEAVCSYEELS